MPEILYKKISLTSPCLKAGALRLYLVKKIPAFTSRWTKMPAYITHSPIDANSWLMNSNA